MCALRTFDCYSTRLKKSAHLLYVSFAVFWELFEMMRLFLYADACQTRHLPTTSYPELRDCLLVSCRRLVGIAVVVHLGGGAALCSRRKARVVWRRSEGVRLP